MAGKETKIPNVTLKQIRAFVAAADEGSLTAAALVVDSTQSSLSVLIRELEATVGLRLFDRTTRKLVLTEAGTEYLEHARRILAEVRHAHMSVTELVERRRGRIVIAAPPIIAAIILPSAIARYRAKYPNIAIIVEDIPPQDIVPAVAAGKIDCGLGVFADDLGEVDAIPLLKEHLMVIAPVGHPLMHRPKLRWSDMRDHSLVAIKGATRIRREMNIRLGIANISKEPEIEVRQMLTTLGMVSSGLGVALWPSWAAALLKAFGVEGRPLSDMSHELWMSIITPRERTLSPAARSFLPILEHEIAKIAGAPEDASEQPMGI